MTFADVPISTIEELQKIGNDPAYPLDGNYYLSNDIDASNTRNWNEGKGFDPILKIEGEEYLGFSGLFEGNGFSIKYIHIDRPENELVGIFGYVNGADIRNINLSDIQINGGKYTGGFIGYATYDELLDKSTNLTNIHINNMEVIGKEWTGGMLGYSSASIKECSVRGIIKSEGSAAGIAGASRYAKIQNCNAIVDVYGNGASGIVGYSQTNIYECNSGGKLFGKYCGGIVYMNFNSKIVDCFSNCYIDANISGGYSAGLVGENQWKVTNSYSTGKISGKGHLKGLIGLSSWFFPEIPEAINSFYDFETTGQYCGVLLDEYGVPKSTADMMNPATFENWDFENVWWMVPGKTYPLLRPERYIDVSVKPAEWVPEPKYGFPLEYEIVFGEEMSDRFTFDDIDFTSSTLESPVGTLNTENGTTWTLMITDTTSTPTWPADLVLRVPLAGATNLANYPCAESNATSITIQAPAIPGDLNGDGFCNNIDKMILVEIIIEPSSPWKTRIPFTRRDLNADNILDVADVVAILPLMENKD